jgi:16S rRNA (cytidine1402-2'-O)-methyltransferase
MQGDGAKVGWLTVCPTPIGNLRDITLRTLDVLREADVIACEDTRRTGILLDHHGLRHPQMALLSLHEHNERERIGGLLRRIRSGAKVALVSDAGMPLICDPGFALVAAAVAAGLTVEVLPGPSALLTALASSGLPVDRFRFEGFLPRGKAELTRLLAHCPETIVAFESPRRLAASLALLSDLDGEREVAVCRELTKLHEQIVRGSAQELASRYSSEQARGEIVLVIAPSKQRGELGQASAALTELIEAGAKPRPAARVLAALTGVSANALYRDAAQR